MQGGGLEIGFVETQNFASLPPSTREGGFVGRSGIIGRFGCEGGFQKK